MLPRLNLGVANRMHLFAIDTTVVKTDLSAPALEEYCQSSFCLLPMVRLTDSSLAEEFLNKIRVQAFPKAICQKMSHSKELLSIAFYSPGLSCFSAAHVAAKTTTNWHIGGGGICLKQCSV